VFTKDRKQISATMDLQRVFDTLNWIFFIVDKNKRGAINKKEPARIKSGPNLNTTA